VIHEEHCDALEVEILRFAAALEAADLQLRVPSCPDWSVEELAGHLGGVHRWSERLVATLASERVSSSSMDLNLAPVNAEWFGEGGASLVATLRAADPDAEMWSWGKDQHVRFWSRRQLHETMMHRVDLEQALGHTSRVEPAVACDAIDEFLVNLESSAEFSPSVRELRGGGEVLSFRTIEGAISWSIQLTGQGFSFVEPSPTPDVELVGAALDVLLLLYRRCDVDAVDVQLAGDPGVLEFWLGHSALE
jgi:uncharacterized protein (TIGR03083 family)